MKRCLGSDWFLPIWCCSTSITCLHVNYNKLPSVSSVLLSPGASVFLCFTFWWFPAVAHLKKSREVDFEEEKQRSTKIYTARETSGFLGTADILERYTMMLFKPWMNMRFYWSDFTWPHEKPGINTPRTHCSRITQTTLVVRDRFWTHSTQEWRHFLYPYNCVRSNVPEYWLAGETI